MGMLIFADASALVGKLLESDPYHAGANRAMRDLLRRGHDFLTTDYIFDEVVTRVRSVASHEAAVSAGEELLASEVIRIVEVEREVRDAAWRKFKKFKEHKLSFTDCTSFAMMEKYGIGEAFTFDEDFKRVGFTTVPRR